ncbi:MAG: NAD(P)-binding domain-containing protein [candidate division Zixibacteria bacterium]|nr:NAD(P)-binding domain-containing protein [candidate division Zixibacteria bacterium]
MMEHIFIWASAGLLIVMVFVPYWLSFRRRHTVAATHKKEAQQLGLDKPRAQYPLIDSSLCIGCGSCVRACPEGDVLGVVYGTAVVINGERCVGHGCCERVCPVGALKVGLGDVSMREDIPIMTDLNETTVPGLFIAGELGGMSLIKNAIDQGQMVVGEIASRISKSATPDGILDVVIVGAGPAGLSAALAAIKHGMSYTILDEHPPGGTILHYPRRKLVMTQPVEIPLYGWLKKNEYSKEELLEIWQDIIGRFSISISSGARVESVTKVGECFEVKTSQQTARSRHVVLAMGRRGTPRKLDVPGEDLAKVTYKLVDAQSYNDCHLLVVGGGDSAVEAAVGLARQSGNTVSISYRKGSFFRVKKKNENAITSLISSKGIRPIFDSQVLEIREKTVLLSTKDGQLEIPNDYVFVLAGGVPPFAALKQMGVTFGGQNKDTKSDKPGPDLPSKTPGPKLQTLDAVKARSRERAASNQPPVAA